MIYYLNRGFILEQALADIITRYIHRLRLDSVYGNFHITVTNDHPFAHLIIHEDSTNTADEFPTIVVTSQTDSKPSELSNLTEQYKVFNLTSSDIDKICNVKRVRTYINDKGEEVTVKNRAGEIQYEIIPGYCLVTDDTAISELKAAAEQKGYVTGIQYVARKKDHVSIEIWAENNQLKNEIYEQLRLFISTTFGDVLRKTYGTFDPALFTNTISGERSNNFNFDFDVILYGGHLTFDIDYSIAQMIIDTDIDENKDIEWEVINHVKES